MVADGDAQIVTVDRNHQGLCAKADCIRGVISRHVNGVPAHLRQYRPGSVFRQRLIVCSANAKNIVAQSNDLLYSARPGFNAKAVCQSDHT
jgi:hypothetical protein